MTGRSNADEVGTNGARPRRLAIRALLAALATGLVGCDQEVRLVPKGTHAARARELPATAPNLVLITLDTTRADALGTLGQLLEPTPYLDALAAEGVLFTQCESAAPITLPSHATLFTGKFPYAHGARSNLRSALPEAHQTLAEILFEQGYRTGAEVAATVLNRHAQLDQGFEMYRDLRSPGVELYRATLDPRGDDPQEVLLPERTAAQITDHGIDFIEQHREEPFFLWVHYFDPHMYYLPPDTYADRIPGSPYHAEIQYMDAQIRRLLDALEPAESGRPTLVVVVADHGEGLNQHGEETHGLFVYETTTRVPLIFWGLESLPPGRRVDSLVRSADIAPTILDLLSLPPFEEEVQGRSLVPLITGEETDLDLLAYGEATESRTVFGAQVLRYVRRGPWKYIHKVDPELFDVIADPDEALNLASREPERMAALRSELEALIASSSVSSAPNEASVDARTQRELQALGYLGHGDALQIEDEVEALALTGSDPVSMADDYHLLSLAVGHSSPELLAAAQPRYREIHERYPGSVLALRALIASVDITGPPSELLALLERLVVLDPQDLRAHRDLVGLLMAAGDLERAEQIMLQGIAIEPCEELLRGGLAALAHSRKDYARERELLEAGLEQCASSDLLRNNYAYLLATSPEAELRDGLRAVELAKEIASQSTPPNPAYLDTLAAAYAEVGLFDVAVKIERQAIEQLEELGAPESTIGVFRAHLGQLEREEPIRSP